MANVAKDKISVTELRSIDYEFANADVWWLAFYAPQINPDYRILLTPPPHTDEVLSVREYSRWAWESGAAHLVRTPEGTGSAR